MNEELTGRQLDAAIMRELGVEIFEIGIDFYMDASDSVKELSEGLQIRVPIPSFVKSADESLYIVEQLLKFEDLSVEFFWIDSECGCCITKKVESSAQGVNELHQKFGYGETIQEAAAAALFKLVSGRGYRIEWS